jgi:prolyl-tRNA editing enzyme YbaK/EbsC (Cys-tRNA(Pro) deacylase)
MRTFLDRDLLAYPTVWAAAGTPHAVFEADPRDLARATGALPISVHAPQ